MRKIKIYIAGPYTNGDTPHNVQRAIEAAEKLFTAGFVPFIPHLNHFWHIQHPHSYQAWLDYDKEWLPLCDCVLRLAGLSEGAEDECALARSLGMPVFYSIDELIAWGNEAKESINEIENQAFSYLENLNCLKNIPAPNVQDTDGSRPVIREFSVGDAT